MARKDGRPRITPDLSAERYRVLSRRGEAVVRTNDQAEAGRLASILGGRIIDTHADQKEFIHV